MNEKPLIQQYLQLRSESIGYLYAITRDSDLAEEVYQNAAVVVIKKEDDTETIQNFRAWAKEVVRRQALLAIRKREKSSKLTRAVSPEMLDVVSTPFIEDDSTMWQESGKSSQVEENRARACPDLQDSIADRFEKK